MSTKDMIEALKYRIKSLKEYNLILAKENQLKGIYQENLTRIDELETLLEYVQIKRAA